MAREFPTYLYYNNYRPGVKSPGKFIVRTVVPRFVGRINEDGTHYSIEILEQWDEMPDEAATIKHAENWYRNNVVVRGGKTMYHDDLIYSERKLEGQCCCDPKYKFNVYDWDGKVHCVHCRLPLLKN